MAISANSVFHFTGSLDVLKSILENGFWPHYCREYGWGNRTRFDFAVPVTCFTDLPLSQIASHVDFYGGYGIGMSRTWVQQQQNMAPVFYLTDYSVKIVNNVRKLGYKSKDNSIHLEDFRLLSLLKKFQGKMKDKNGTLVSKVFYDEREWRYVPPIENLTDAVVKIEEQQKFDATAYNEMMYNYRLSFRMQDVNYLFIKDETDRLRLLQIIDQIYSSETVEDRAVLKSKILSTEQLKMDM